MVENVWQLTSGRTFGDGWMPRRTHTHTHTHTLKRPSKISSLFTGDSKEACPQGWKCFQRDSLTSSTIAVAYSGETLVERRQNCIKIVSNILWEY
jgi:hypothetical protein